MAFEQEDQRFGTAQSEALSPVRNLWNDLKRLCTGDPLTI